MEDVGFNPVKPAEDFLKPQVCDAEYPFGYKRLLALIDTVNR